MIFTVFTLVLLHALTTFRTPLYVVMGGSGQQAQGAVDVLLKRHVHVRIMSSMMHETAERLSQRGVEVLISSGNEAKDWDRLFEGEVDGVFVVTFSGPEERQIGERLAKFIQESRIPRVVFSGGQETPHEFLNAKADIEKSMRSIFTFTEAVYIHTNFFYENLLSKGKSDKRIYLSNDSVVLKSALPYDLKIPMISSYDIGRIAGSLLQSSKGFIANSSFTAVGDYVSPHSLIDAFEKAVPERQFTYEQIPLDSFRGQGMLGNMIATMYEWYFEQTVSHAGIQETRDLFKGAMNLTEWIQNRGIFLAEELLSVSLS